MKRQGDTAKHRLGVAGRLRNWAYDWGVWTLLALAGIGVLIQWRLPEEPPPPVTSGTVVGWRFSGDYPHRCRLWIKPPGAFLGDKVLVDPNSEAECLASEIGDWWQLQS